MPGVLPLTRLGAKNVVTSPNEVPRELRQVDRVSEKRTPGY